MAKSKLKTEEVNRAQSGPRDLKDPRSREYAIQTVRALRTYVQMKDADEKRVRRELDEIKRYKHWEVLGYSSEDELLEAEVGLSRQAIIDRAKNAKPLANSGANQHTEGVDNINSSSGGTSSDYLTARIARDHPDILNRMKAGEFKSVRSAAIEAGIITLPTPLELLKRAWNKASEKDRQAFLSWIEQVPA